MLGNKLFYLLFALVGGATVDSGRCKSAPNTSKKVAEGIKQCQETIKTNMIEEAFHIIRYQWNNNRPLQSSSSAKPVHQIQHIYRPQSFRPMPGDHQHSPPPIYRPSSVAPSPIAVNYTEFLAAHSNTQSNHYIDHQQPQQVIHHVYADAMDPVVLQQVHGGPNSQHDVGMGLHNDFVDVPAVPDDLTYYQYESFDPTTQRRRRRSDGLSASGMSVQDKRIAGCLMHCIYSRNHAVDKKGWPTLDGLVSFYSEGVDEHAYFMATLRASNACLKILSAKYHVNRLHAPAQGQSCDLSFDVFDCISDKLTDYCGTH